MRFFGDLSMHVSELVSPPNGVDPGFIDRSIDGGAVWRQELLDAARTCQVFLPLLSPAYPASSWCMREWKIFAARAVHPREPRSTGSPTAIVPVIWVPTANSSLPASIRRIQRFNPERLPDPHMAAQYRENGLYGLLSTKQEEAYANVVWKLAQRVAEIYHRYRVELGGPDADDDPPQPQEGS